MNVDPTTILGDVFAQLAQAWNDADGARFGELFSDEADFVNIRGAHHHGSAAIAHGHQEIFDTIYKGSTVQFAVLESDTITDGCLLGLVQATLDAPSGPLQGIHHAIITALVVGGGNSWKIRAFHNTLVAE